MSFSSNLSFPLGNYFGTTNVQSDWFPLLQRAIQKHKNDQEIDLRRRKYNHNFLELLHLQSVELGCGGLVTGNAD